MEFAQTTQGIVNTIIQVGLKVIGALIIYVVGRWLINLAVSLLQRTLNKQQVDAALVRYLSASIVVAANIALIVAILGFFGVETTTFAALVAAVGIAIGAAWGGLLANFAAGAFLIILRPFQVGDFIGAGGVVGMVREIGLFVTAIDTLDNVRTYVGNTKVFADNIQNFSTNPFRRVEQAVQLSYGVDPGEAMQRLRQKLRQVPNVLSEPIPEVEILQFTPSGPILAVRPYCRNQDYWQVYFDTNRLISQSFGEAGYPAPEQHLVVRNAG
ncbi:mechanosensitive ion channel family protein [Anthocerotibacter panamensis]|uniref:mechanosensitive ion channel family protein n=1 Tax=Anthocerotibacter panamensis TaxID=2857077 RepID=UPI001C405258|nr:mechanosensitive ion channel family protein [Anthocerotibacter panamensis]